MVQRCSQVWHSRAGHGMIPSFVPVLDTIPIPSTKLSHLSNTSAAVHSKVAFPGTRVIVHLPLWWIRGFCHNLVHSKMKQQDSDTFSYPCCLINECCQKKSSSCYFEACIGSLYDDCSLGGEEKGNFCARLLLLDIKSHIRQRMLEKKNEVCAEEAHIHYFRLEEIPYSKKPEQLDLLILSRRRLSGELITTDKHLVGRKYQALKGSLI